jgi:hypothetical protein
MFSRTIVLHRVERKIAKFFHEVSLLGIERHLSLLGIDAPKEWGYR